MDAGNGPFLYGSTVLFNFGEESGSDGDILSIAEVPYQL